MVGGTVKSSMKNRRSYETTEFTEKFSVLQRISCDGRGSRVADTLYGSEVKSGNKENNGLEDTEGRQNNSVNFLKYNIFSAFSVVKFCQYLVRRKD
ncbi:MAG: hypothetical protein NTZ51_04380, partial [Proteobacteria bacterium]|nr:hypothetical protein [Pseudomonadota bacterium]